VPPIKARPFSAAFTILVITSERFCTVLDIVIP
jgi:hypothetical protein